MFPSQVTLQSEAEFGGPILQEDSSTSLWGESRACFCLFSPSVTSYSTESTRRLPFFLTSILVTGNQDSCGLDWPVWPLQLVPSPSLVSKAEPSSLCVRGQQTLQDWGYIFCLVEVTKKSNFGGNLFQISVVLKEVKFSSHSFLFEVKEYFAKQRSSAIVLFFFFFLHISSSCFGLPVLYRDVISVHSLTWWGLFLKFIWSAPQEGCWQLWLPAKQIIITWCTCPLPALGKKGEELPSLCAQHCTSLFWIEFGWKK